MWKRTLCLCYTYLYRYSWLYLISFIFTIVWYFNVTVLTLYLCIHLQLGVYLASSRCSINNPIFWTFSHMPFLYPVHRLRSGIGGSFSTSVFTRTSYCHIALQSRANAYSHQRLWEFLSFNTGSNNKYCQDFKILLMWWIWFFLAFLWFLSRFFS